MQPDFLYPLLIACGATVILQSSVRGPVRWCRDKLIIPPLGWITRSPATFQFLFNCQKCLGFWVGAIVGVCWWGWFGLTLGLATSFVCPVVWSITGARGVSMTRCEGCGEKKEVDDA